jgi:DNA-binding LacI/PurR family transcriptional regulator
MNVTGHTRRQPSIRDVATAAGVSYQTVSRVINEHPSVKPATRERVNRAIEELGFRRSATALALASGRSRSVTVLTSHTMRYGYAAVIQGVEEAARKASYAVGVSVLEPGDEQAQAAAVQRAGDAAGGLIVIAYDPAGVAALAAVEAGTPVVGVVETPSSTPSQDRPWVWTDDHAAAYEATSHLLSLGHGTVHHVAIPSGTRRHSARTAGWQRALEDAGAPVPEVVQGGGEPAGGREAGLRLARDRQVTAVLCGNDDLALGVMRALHESGRAVPDDVSVVGFDDAPHSAYLAPSRTTVRLDVAGLGRSAFDLLHGVVTQATPVAPHSAASPELVVRESTAPPAHRR